MISEKYQLSEELSRLDIEWVTYNALRDGVGLGLRDLGLANHKDTLRLAQKIAPDLFATSDSLLVKEWESPEQSEIGDIATAQGISFEDALDSEIKRIESLINGNHNKKNRLDALDRRLRRFKRIKSEIALREYYEGKLIERDARIGHGGVEKSKQSDDYFDFTLPSNRFMRIRVVHETRVEAINGADLIYEHHDLKLNQVRVAAVQYKILEKDRYVSKSRQLSSQLTRLEGCFCKALPCKGSEAAEINDYRLPTCAAFLRPTHRLQSNKASVVSRGFYLPVCITQALWRNKSEISEEAVNNQVVRQAMFEELFNASLLGSRWLSIEELDALYLSQQVLIPYETSLIHVKLYNQ